MAIGKPGGLIDRALRFLGIRTKAGDLLKQPGPKQARRAAPKGKGRAGGGGG